MPLFSYFAKKIPPMKAFFMKYKYWFAGFVIFLLTAFYLYKPVLEGKKLMGTDSLMFLAMEQERINYLKEHGHETYWTNSVFGGMPTYLLGASYPNDLPSKIDKILKFFPRPIDSLFLYFIGFLILMWVLGVRPLPAIAGAMGFTLSTYLIIILQVGHYAKATAIAYFPWVLAGVFLVWKRHKYLPGFILTAIAMALEIHAKHYQMTYYLGLAIVILGILYLIRAVEEKRIKQFFFESLLLLAAVVIATGLNWTSMAATKQYISQSIRGEQFLTINPDGSKKNKKEGLDYNYITEYSYGIAESMNLFIPGFYGGSNQEKLGENSALYQVVKEKAGTKTAKQFIERVSLYWGDQPIVMAPAYIGAVIWLLALLGLLLSRGTLRKWIIITSILVLLLSWGKNFSWLTDLFINYVPYYNKFRVVASIQVILELLVPVLAVLGITAFFDTRIDKNRKLKALKISTGILAGLALLFMILGGSLFDFTSPHDSMYEQYGLLDALIRDRKTLLFNDSLRSLVFVLLTAAVLWAYLQRKINEVWGISIVILLIIIDLGGVAMRYIHQDDFMTQREINRIFQPTPVDKAILKDNTYYRVINLARNPLTDGLTSYHHKNLGGYHAAKPRRIQDIFDFHLTGNIHYPVLNMYNVKYIIFNDKKGLNYTPNPEAFGNAWFVDKLVKTGHQNEEIKKLDSIDKSVAYYSEGYPDLEGFTPVKDSTSTVKLVRYEPNRLEYEASNPGDGFIVFSENYYPYGWHAEIDGNPAEIYRVNYSLRAIKFPAGTHKIVMKFDPEVVRKGSYIQLIFITLLLISILIYVIKIAWKNKRK